MLPFATGGDQEFYREFYANVFGLNFGEAYVYFFKTLGTQEPGYFILIYALSGVIEKSFFMSFLNAWLGYCIAYWLSLNKVSAIVLVPLVFNFYLMVLFFSAERLKLALLFFMLMAISSGWKKNVLMLASLASHVQLAVLFMSQAFRSIEKPFLRLFLYMNVQKPAAKHFVLLLLMALGTIFLWDHVMSKLYYYEGKENIISLWKPLVFLIFTMFYARNDFFNVFVQHLVIIVASLVVGEERLVIFSYLIFMSYAIKVNRGVNIGVLLTSAYFFIKGLDFMYNIYVYGDGFKAAMQG